MFSKQSPPNGEPLKIHLDATTEAVRVLVKYLYTDANIDSNDVTEDLINLASKYNLNQLKDYCLPTFMKKLDASNCLSMYSFAYKLNFNDLKTSAFKYLNGNWKLHQNSLEFLEMMKTNPNSVLDIMKQFQEEEIGITACDFELK